MKKSKLKIEKLLPLYSLNGISNECLPSVDDGDGFDAFAPLLKEDALFEPFLLGILVLFIFSITI